MGSAPLEILSLERGLSNRPMNLQKGLLVMLNQPIGSLSVLRSLLRSLQSPSRGLPKRGVDRACEWRVEYNFGQNITVKTCEAEAVD